MGAKKGRIAFRGRSRRLQPALPAETQAKARAIKPATASGGIKYEMSKRLCAVIVTRMSTKHSLRACHSFSFAFRWNYAKMEGFTIGRLSDTYREIEKGR